MRLYPVIALMTSAFALTACGGGGGGFGGSVLGVSSGVGNTCPITNVNTTPDPNCNSTGGGTDDVAIVDDDGDGVDDNTDSDGDGIPDDDDGDVGGGAGGNTTGLTTGNKSIFLAKYVMDKPTTGATALSTLSSDTTTTLAATTAAILGANKPKKLLFTTDTKSKRNSTLAVAEIQSEYLDGTRDMRWVWLGHTTANMGAIAAAVTDKNGNPLMVSGTGDLVYSVSDPAGEFSRGEDINFEDDNLWNQIKPYMNAKANGGAGADYREYRLRSTDEENPRDEALQVWAWKDSYATEYRNGASSGEPKHEIWSFGGNAATTVPTGGTALYNGRWVGTAKTANWKQVQGSDINPNALWMLQGSSTFVADFDNSKVSGKLSAETWTSEQSENPMYTWYTTASGTPSIGTGAEPEYMFYNKRVVIEGNLVNDGTLTGAKNQIVGNASVNGGFLTGDNSVLGGLFGTNAEELTGVFHVTATTPAPIGGSTGTTNGKEGVLIINGAFNGGCAQNPDGTCVGTTP